MTSPSTISPKFLSAGNELGVVAVGFSGGQVSAPLSSLCSNSVGPPNV